MKRTFSQALAGRLFRYANAAQTRLFLLSELLLLEGSHRSLGKGQFKRVLVRPNECEDWINLARFLKPSERILLIDIGANVGAFTSEFLKAFPNSRSVCFEPAPETFQLLSRNLEGNPRVQLHCAAISDKSGAATLHIFEDSTLNSLTYYSAEANEHYQTSLKTSKQIECRKLDDVEIAGTYDKLFVKIDVQGFEKEAIAGGPNLLAKADAVLLECSFVNEYVDKEPSFSICTALLREAGLYPVVFQSYGMTLSNYAFERDVLYVRRELLQNIWFRNYD